MCMKNHILYGDDTAEKGNIPLFSQLEQLMYRYYLFRKFKLLCRNNIGKCRLETKTHF